MRPRPRLRLPNLPPFSFFRAPIRDHCLRPNNACSFSYRPQSTTSGGAGGGGGRSRHRGRRPPPPALPAVHEARPGWINPLQEEAEGGMHLLIWMQHTKPTSVREPVMMAQVSPA